MSTVCVMELVRKSSSPRSESRKFAYKCGVPTEGYLWVEEILHNPKNGSGILKGLLDKQKEVVVKVGVPKLITKEYSYGTLLRGIPNFMRFYCSLTCDETITSVMEKNYHTTHTICNDEGNNLGLVLMPYYRSGSVANYTWNVQNMDVLKSVLSQVAMALLIAYREHGFIHNDLHLDNVLLRPTKKKHVEYDGVVIETRGLYPIIMDFERSRLHPERNQPRDVYHGISKVIHLSGAMDDNSTLALDTNIPLFGKLMSKNEAITKDVMKQVCSAIFNIKLLYDKTKLPPNPLHGISTKPS